MPVPLRLAAMCLAVLTISACSAARIDQTRLIDDMLSQLERGRKVTYLASYQLSGGENAVVAQANGRTAITYPGGMILLDATGETTCDVTLHPAKCQLRALAPAAAGLPDAYAEAAKRGLVTEPLLTDLLRLTVLQPKAVVIPKDATIAGQEASCLTIKELEGAITSSFEACVTSDGVVATFAGEIAGVRIDQALSRIGRKPADDLFALPAGAKIQDLRQ